MKAIIELKDEENCELINIDNIKDVSNFFYKDVDNIEHMVNIFNDGIIINRKAEDHITTVNLRSSKDTYIEIISKEGAIKIDVKLLEFNNNNDIIFLVYKIDDMEKSIKINFLGE